MVKQKHKRCNKIGVFFFFLLRCDMSVFQNTLHYLEILQKQIFLINSFQLFSLCVYIIIYRVGKTICEDVGYMITWLDSINKQD